MSNCAFGRRWENGMTGIDFGGNPRQGKLKASPAKADRMEADNQSTGNSLESALEKIRWYAMRWKIETFHKILKSGCHAEQSKLRTTERLSKLIAVFCILSWRIFWMTMVGRINPKESPETVLTETEIKLLDKLISSEKDADSQPRVGRYLLKIARLGGYLARASGPPPGNMVMWRRVSRLIDIHLGFLLAKGDVGN